MLDIFVVFNTAIQETNFNLIEDRKKIAKRYFSGMFILDFTALLPLDYLYMDETLGNHIQMFMILRLYKMIRISRLFKVYYEITDITKTSHLRDISNINYGVLRLFFFLIIFFLICHLIACSWVIIAKFKVDEYESSWLDNFVRY